MPAPELDKITLRLNATRTKIMNKGSLADQVYVNNYLFEALKENGAIKVGDFGRGAEFDMLYQGNDTAKWMSRWEKYNTTPGTEIKPAIFEVKKLGGTASIDTDSMDENDSDEKIWDMVKEKTSDALSSIQSNFESGLHNLGTDAKAILGIRAVIADDPTSNPSAYNVGGIDRSVAANAFWRNQYNTSAGLGATVSSVDLKAAMRAMWSVCKRNAPKSVAGKKKEPTIIYCDWDVLDMYEAIHDSNDLHVRKDDNAGSGYPHLVYKRTVPLIPGDNANIAGRMYFLNLNKDGKGNPFFGLFIDKKANFKLGKWMEETDQDAYVQKIKVKGVFGGPFMKCHGVVYGIG